jgi:hypothetical protein
MNHNRSQRELPRQENRRDWFGSSVFMPNSSVFMPKLNSAPLQLASSIPSGIFAELSITGDGRCTGIGER